MITYLLQESGWFTVKVFLVCLLKLPSLLMFPFANETLANTDTALNAHPIITGSNILGLLDNYSEANISLGCDPYECVSIIITEIAARVQGCLIVP